MVQVRVPDESGDSGVLQFADGSEVVVTAHVTKEGTPQEDRPGDIRQRLDVETEQIVKGSETFEIHSGLRVSVYDQQSKQEPAQEADTGTVRLFHYGTRLRFPAKLSPPRNFRNPGAFDYRAYLAENGIVALASVKSASVEVLPGFAGSQIELWRSRIHCSIIEKVHALWAPREAELMDAMVIGEDAFIKRPTRAGFQRSGTYHVLVVSGMNVSILALVTFWFLRRMHVSDLIAGAITGLLMVVYAFLTALGSPVWRATLMLALYLGARLLYREKSMLNAIGAAALGLLIADPQVLFGASFQLTFLSVWLVAAVRIPILERTTQPFVRGSRHLDSKSYDFALPAQVVQFRLDLRMIAGRLQVPTPGIAVILLSALSIVLAMVLVRRSWLAVSGLATLAASAFWICAVPPRPQVRPAVLEMTAIDVGQGDSILLVSPNGRTLPVDAGGLPHWVHSDLDIGEDVVSPYFWSRSISRLDAVAITHAHADHMGGAAAILVNFRPRELWLGDPSDPEMATLLQEAKDLGIRVIHRRMGESFDFGWSRGSRSGPRRPESEGTAQ